MAFIIGTHNTSLSLNIQSRAHRNVVSASDLLYDVLLHIFLILRDAHGSSEEDLCVSRNKKWCWIVVSMICRRWRNIAIECPSLWTKIRNFHSADQIRTFLERSGQTEFNIDMRIPSSDPIGLRALFKGHMWRVRVFRFAANREVMDSMVSRLSELTRHAKVLDLTCIFDMHEGIQNKRLLQSLPDTIPDVKLDALSLDSMTLPWSSHLYYGLSKLTTTSKRMGMRQEYIPNIWEFVNALEHCPNLQHLTLDECCPAFGNASVPEIEKRKLRFAHLRSIAFRKILSRRWSRLFAAFAIGANVDLDVLLLVDYEYPRPKPLPPNALIERNRCKSIRISLHTERCTISDTCTTSPNTTISALVPHTFNTKGTVLATRTFLQDRFWQHADEVTISFEVNTTHVDLKMSTNLWCALLDGLPKLVKRLTVRFAYNSYEGHDIGFAEALSSITDGRVKLPELDKLTAYYVMLPSELVMVRQRLLFENMEDRRRHAVRACKVLVVEKQFNHTGFYTTLETEHVFDPISIGD